MKKAVITIIIFSILAISLTFILIDVKKSKIRTDHSYSEYNIEKGNNENTNNNISENEESQIVFGESTYFENPIKIEYIKDNVSYDEYQYNLDYIEISGLKDKTLQNKINEILMQNSNLEVQGNFSNVLSISDFLGKEIHNLSIATGEELKPKDYFSDLTLAQNYVKPYITKSIYNTFGYGRMSDRLGNADAVNLYENSFNSQIENWEIEIINKLKREDFNFYFTEDKIFLIFSNINFAISNSLIGVKSNINDLVVDIPIYALYPCVDIYNKFADANLNDIYENSTVKTFLIGMKDFEKNENVLYFNAGNIENLNSFNSFLIDFDELEKANEKWNTKFDSIKQLNDKKAICFNKQCAGSMGSVFWLQYYMIYDKNMLPEIEQEILAKIAKAYDVLYDSLLYDSLLDISNKIKTNYKNIEYELELIGSEGKN